MLPFLPTSKTELENTSSKKLDIILISGDAYIDHPGFGVPLIGRFLQSKGFSVGIIPQPDWKNDSDFQCLGTPRLFFGISSGNMDSMVNHYTAQKKIRREDAYSPDGKTGLRPNRATTVYAHKIKELFKNVPIIIGGIEASLRRIPHYDFWSEKIRNSILIDSKADILVYGMGEKAILEIAEELRNGKPVKDINNVKGTVVSIKHIDSQHYFILEAFNSNTKDFFRLNKQFQENCQTKTVYQKFSQRYLKHNPPAKALDQNEMDEIYNLPFTRLPHPRYKGKSIKAFEQIKCSVTSHRGCFGGCNFCAIGLHQGKTIQSRSNISIRKEISLISKQDYFNGTVSDIGGPTANMYGMSCKKKISETCLRKSCLMPNVCSWLDKSHLSQIKLLRRCLTIPRIKNIFIASGIRFDLALFEDKYIRQIAELHTGGLLKLAPEHNSSKVLKCMNKPGFELYQNFVESFRKHSKKIDRSQHIVPYIIAGHPGSNLNETLKLAVFLKNNNIKLKQIQEFTPTPMTDSSLMYYTGLNMKGETIHIPKGREIRLQKALIQWFIPTNRKLVIEALKKINREDLINNFVKKA